MCDNSHQMISSFRDVGISLNTDGSEDDQIKFHGRPQVLVPPTGFVVFFSSFSMKMTLEPAQNRL